MTTTRRMENREIERIAEIDRSEHVVHEYVQRDATRGLGRP